MYVCMHACMYVRMYVCIYVCMKYGSVLAEIMMKYTTEGQ